MRWALLLVLGCNAQAVPPLYGTASVIDGDTLELLGRRIRLHGIDAPESSQPCTDALGASWRCGVEAARALDALIAGRPVTCDDRGEDRYGRTLSVCRVGDMDLNRALVRSGWALAYRRYAMDYVPDEDLARAEKAGVWAGTFQAPWDYRSSRRSSSSRP